MSTDFMRYTTPVERRIARALLDAIFAVPGRYVTVHDGEGETGLITRREQVTEHLASTGQDSIVIYEGGEKIGWVWLVWGNDEDVITDYSDNEATRAIVDATYEALGMEI
jgi:hypothetical protein